MEEGRVGEKRGGIDGEKESDREGKKEGKKREGPSPNITFPHLENEGKRQGV